MAVVQEIATRWQCLIGLKKDRFSSSNNSHEMAEGAYVNCLVGIADSAFAIEVPYLHIQWNR
jgi:hypothetical protein